jgi:hypothetical protein
VSGRPKGAPADPAARLEASTAAARQVLRELHEAIKDARALSREIDAHVNKAVAHIGEQMVTATEMGSGKLDTLAMQIMDHLQQQVEQISDHIAGILGSASADELTRVIVKEAARQLAAQLVLGIDEDGAPAILPKVPG